MQMLLYVKPGCPWCTEAVDFLNENDYQFEEIDVLSDRKAYEEMIELSGQSLTPTLKVGDLVLPDFDVGELVQFLEKNGLKKD